MAGLLPLPAPSARSVRWHSRLIPALFVLILIAAHAGGLGIAPLAAIGGAASLLVWRSAASWPLPQWVLAFVLFLSWAALTAFWSPYFGKGLPNPVKLLIGASLYALFVPGLKDFAARYPKRAAAWMMWAPIAAAALLVLDTATGYGLSLLVDPVNPGEDPTARLGDAEMNVGHGITLMNLLLAPAIATLLWVHRRGQWLSIALMAMGVLAAYFGGLNVGIVAIIISVLAMGAALISPKRTIRTLTLTAMGLVLFAPLIGGLVGLASPGLRAGLPFSWEHRIVTWSHVAEKIREAPILGHGFDAARTFSETFSARGFDGLAKVSLHPHNAGLHIWVETGVIGAVLAAVLIWTLGQKAEDYAAGGRPRALAVSGFMAAVILIASVSYGVWQDWWWASLFSVAGLLYFVPSTRR